MVTARIAVHEGPGHQQLTPYLSQLFPALSALQRLELGWDETVELLPQLLHLSALVGVTALQLGWEPLLAHYSAAWALDVPALLEALRSVPWLQEVDILLDEEYYEGATEQELRLGLQEALPALRCKAAASAG